MSSDLEHSVGPLQLVLVGFETTERFRGEVARELANLRGRGMIRVLDARLFTRSATGRLTEVDLSPLLAGRRPRSPTTRSRTCSGPTAAAATARATPAEAFARTAGFALEDLRRLTEEIEPAITRSSS